MHRFYIENFSENSTALLDAFESKHATRVLRLKVDDRVEVVDGKGRVGTAKIIDVNPKIVSLFVESVAVETDSGCKVHVAIAPTKNIDRLEWFIEKSTEIGISEFSLILTKNSERKVVNHDRLNKILISAFKQSGNPFLPTLNSLTKFSDFLNQEEDKENQKKFIAYCGEHSLKKELHQVSSSSKSVLLLIGPEGDFTQEEVELTVEKGFIPVSLNRNRLRTETAGLIACHTVLLANSNK